MPKRDWQREHLGDGVYAEYNGFHVVIESEEDRVKNRIWIEPGAFRALVAYEARARRAHARRAAKAQPHE